MEIHPSVAERLARLAPDQRAAATASPGPLLCIAPAGSGKTTTLVARTAWLIATGTPPETIRAITFNRRAATEMTERLDAALAPLGVAPGTVAVRTFHATGREILKDAGADVEHMADRLAILREVVPGAAEPDLLRIDTAISRLKVELGVSPEDVAADSEAGPVARAFVAYERAVADARGLDFDDLILRAISNVEADADLLRRWRGRCQELLVDEVQDVDRAQLRLALLLAAPANRIFLVGDDDQSIYGWRLADVRRILGLADQLAGLRRVDLKVNYRCPRHVVERAVRLIEHNTERYDKQIRAGPTATGVLVLAPDGSDETVRLERAVRAWPADDSSRAILARTNRELLPAVAVALELRIPFRAAGVELLLDAPEIDGMLDRVMELGSATGSPLIACARLRAGLVSASPAEPAAMRLASAMLGWAARYDTTPAFVDAVRATRARLSELRRDDAALTLSTAHATKGLEFDHVIVVGMEAGRFPSGRSVADASDPVRAYEEERRLAYVAWTRARRSLTLLYDPTTPSPFLLEAFTAEELGLTRVPGAGPG